MEFTAIARRLGLVSAAATVLLVSAYAVTLTMGLLSLGSPDQPIRNPMFAILEILIIVMMPAIVGLMIAVHAWAPTGVKALSFAAVVFMGLLAGLTSSLHFVILTVSREPEFARQSWLGGVRRHATAQHWHRRLCSGIPRRRRIAGRALLPNGTLRYQRAGSRSQRASRIDVKRNRISAVYTNVRSRIEEPAFRR